MSDHYCERGCFGATYGCGHSFDCCEDPKATSHRCGAGYNNAIFSLLMGLVALAMVLSLRGVL